MLVFLSQIVCIKIAQLTIEDFLGWMKFGEMLQYRTQFPVLQTTNTTLEVVLTSMLKSVAAESLIVQKLLSTFGAYNVLFPGRSGLFVIADMKLQVPLIIKDFSTHFTWKTDILFVSFDMAEFSFLIQS